MDKTYNDLMDIVNRTKKMNGDEIPVKIRREIRKSEPVDYEEDNVREKKTPSKSLFGDSSAINKLLNKEKKPAKKTSTKKATDDKKKITTKKTTKKESVKKETAKKPAETKSKVSSITDKIKNIKSTKTVTPANPTIDMSDPKNAELYKALHGTLFAGGTDISDYEEKETPENSTSSLLSDLKKKHETDRINTEITKEQQEYEQLFTGSFFQEENTQVEDRQDEPQEETKPQEVEPKEEIAEEETTEEVVEENKEVLSNERLSRLDKGLAELKARDEEIDRKIAEYYRLKQEKINKYNEETFGPVNIEEEKKEEIPAEDRQQAYEDIFSGEVVSRAKLMGIEEDVEEEKPSETVEESVENNEEEKEESIEQSQDENSTEEKEEDTQDAEENGEINANTSVFATADIELEESEDETEDSTTDAEEIEEESDVEDDNEIEDTQEDEVVEDSEEENKTEEEDVEEFNPFAGFDISKLSAKKEQPETVETPVEEIAEETPVESVAETTTEETEKTIESEDQSTTEEIEEIAEEEIVTDTEESTEEPIEEESSEEVVEEEKEEEQKETITAETSVFATLGDDVEETTEDNQISNKLQDNVVEKQSTEEESEKIDEYTSVFATPLSEEKEESETLVEVEKTDTEETPVEVEEDKEEITTEEKTVIEDPVEDTIESTDKIIEEVEEPTEEVVVGQETVIEEETEETEVEEEKTDEDRIVESLEEPEIDESKDDASAEAFVESVEESTYADDDYADYDDDELDRIDRSQLRKVQTMTEELKEEIEESIEETFEDVVEEDEEEKDIDWTEYIVSSNMPIEEEEKEVELPTQEYIEEENAIVINTQALPEVQIDILGEDVEEIADEEDETSEEEIEEKQEETVSKEEFYNEMARLQENLINELKGQKSEEVEKPRDFFEEKPRVELAQDNTPINKALDIISNLTSQPASEEKEEIVVVENTPEEKQDPSEALKEATAVVEEILTEITQDVNEEKEVSDEETLLNKDLALNEEDLEFFHNSQKPKDFEKDDCFYMSDEDKTKKAEFEDEYMNVYNEEIGQTVEVGDINLNKNIHNAIPFSEEVKLNNEKALNTENADDEIETIYTLFGMERKKMEKQKEDMKVLYVASECQPFIATGGLADVAGSLPKAIAEKGGVDIRVIMPLYGTIKNEYRDQFEYLGNFTVHLAWRQEYCGLFKYFKDGVTYYFIDNERYFKREKTYGYYDDGERFAYFSKAIVEALPMLNFFPDIIHCNDWQSALVSTYIKTGDWSDFRYYKIKNVYTIHNVEYQGVYGMENIKDLFGINPRFRNDIEYNGDINLTKAAIQYSDKFTTVSESYCDNLKQPYCSRGLHHSIIRNEYKLCGIINGIDYDFYNPETDKIIYKNYSVDTLRDKVMNKKIWQDELGLPVDGRTPMLAIVSRLVSHKGLDLLSKVIENILQQDIQLVVVGTGDQKYVDYYKYLESKYPTKVRAMVDKFSAELARKAYGASDIFIMPSKVEPCGISQMIASRYGSIPVVREVGGLKDTIKDFGCEGGGNGYTFTNYNPTDLEYQINRAITDYQDQENWEKKMRIAMTTDFRWSKSAEKYIELYKSLV